MNQVQTRRSRVGGMRRRALLLLIATAAGLAGFSWISLQLRQETSALVGPARCESKDHSSCAGGHEHQSAESAVQSERRVALPNERFLADLHGTPPAGFTPPDQNRLHTTCEGELPTVTEVGQSRYFNPDGLRLTNHDKDQIEVLLREHEMRLRDNMRMIQEAAREHAMRLVVAGEYVRVGAGQRFPPVGIPKGRGFGVLLTNLPSGETVGVTYRGLEVPDIAMHYQTRDLIIERAFMELETLIARLGASSDQAERG